MSDTLQLPVRTQAPSPAPAKAARPNKSLTVRVFESGDLRKNEDAWWTLCNNALVPNAFYEPWMVLPALEQPNQEDVRFLLVFGPADPTGNEPLLGLFPLEIQTRCLHLPIRTLAFWKHRNCLLTTPLIDAGHVWQVLDAFWRWFESNPFRARILDTNYLLADGRFHEVWSDFSIGRTSLMLRDFPRAFLVPNGTGTSYIANAVSKKHFDEYLRLERRLSEVGKLEYRQIQDPAEVDAWLDQFLALEASGWKGGSDGNAFAKKELDSSYFRTMTHLGFARDRVMLLSLELDGKAIAMKHNLLAGDGGFAFRITYEESYAKYSPGLLLELENIRRVSDHPRINWLDSCAKPRHSMADRIWRERRMIRRSLISDGSSRGDLWVSVLPLLRWMRLKVKRQPDQDYLQVSTKLKSGK